MSEQSATFRTPIWATPAKRGTVATDVPMFRFAITPPEPIVALQLGILAALFVLAAGLLHLRGPRSSPAMVLKLILGGLALLTVATFYASKNSEVVLTERHLAFKVPGFYGRAVSWANVDFDGVRVADLELDAELQPKVRTNGIGLYGYRLGWFKVSTGHMAWLAVTQPRRVVVVPQIHGPVDIVSVMDPDGLVAQLQRIGARVAAASSREESEDASDETEEALGGAGEGVSNEAPQPDPSRDVSSR